MIVAGHKIDNHFAPVRVLAVGDFLAAHPGWVVELHLNRPGEGGYYIPGTTEIVNGMLFWTPDRTDTEHEGIGQLQVFARGMNDEFGALCDKVDVRIKASLTDPVEITEPMVPYFEAVLEEAAKIRVTAQDVKADREAADQSASQAQSALRDLEQKIASGDFKGDPGYTPVKGVDYFDGKDGYTPVKGKDYFDGSDANVTAENISSALGYEPADAEEVTDLKSQISKLDGKVADTENDIGELKGDIAQQPKIVESDKSGPDFDISDDDGNIVFRVEGGHVKTKNFDSSAIDVDVDVFAESDNESADLDISDESGNVLMRLQDGRIITKAFDSANENHWRGAAYISHGDSITWYDGHNYSDGTPCVGYQSVMGAEIGFDAYNNQGWSGHSMADGTANGDGIVTRILSLDHTGFDLCTIAAGTNDFRLDVPIGAIGTIGDSTFDRNTFYGAYRASIEYLLTQKPTLRIVLLTPLQRDNSGYNVNRTNAAGHKLIDYVNAVKAIGEMYGLPVCDMYAQSGFTKLTLATYTIDGLHPSNEGFQRMGHHLARFIKNIGR